jgi:hypothetical protein
MGGYGPSLYWAVTTHNKEKQQHGAHQEQEEHSHAMPGSRPNYTRRSSSSKVKSKRKCTGA